MSGFDGVGKLLDGEGIHGGQRFQWVHLKQMD